MTVNLMQWLWRVYVCMCLWATSMRAANCTNCQVKLVSTELTMIILYISITVKLHQVWAITVCVCVLVYMHVWVCAWLCKFVCVWVCVMNICMCMPVCVCVWDEYLHMHACVCVCVMVICMVYCPSWLAGTHCCFKTTSVSIQAKYTPPYI